MKLMTYYRDEFLSALGQWQYGWAEEASGRLRATADLLNAIAQIPDGPDEIFRCEQRCYRKRFLVPNNAQNGGDMVPLLWDGRIDEGVASWTTDFNFARFVFKREPRPGEIGAVFAVLPRSEDVVLNIASLWAQPEFVSAVENYVLRSGPNHEALENFRDLQSEVILKAPLALDDVQALCLQIPSLEQVCAKLCIQDDVQVEAVWAVMVDRDWFPTSAFWSEGAEAQLKLSRTLDKFRAMIEEQVPNIDEYRT